MFSEEIPFLESQYFLPCSYIALHYCTEGNAKLLSSWCSMGLTSFRCEIITESSKSFDPIHEIISFLQTNFGPV
jgi:hypothetical protein